MNNHQKVGGVACCNAKETQRATNTKNHATDSATINATNNLKALAGAVLCRNQLRNDCATTPQKTAQFLNPKNNTIVAQNPLNKTTISDTFFDDDRRYCRDCIRRCQTNDDIPRRCPDFIQR
ncbi:hypothetical protein VZ94_06595 [Methylocucumis oryzae]|uniref:Uncharacterized protein n=2 Tax=Methylocucumis oryzae TaxID=1632867 RepID=A0A0F3IKW9_9GAMM|nr:hypothetical protein VZ94_06595 [Methylocucumis oryzae]